jgi:hypothetical protein
VLEQQLQSVLGTPSHCPVGVDVVVVVVASSQQSALLAQLLPEVEKSLRQLLLPHVKLPAQ